MSAWRAVPGITPHCLGEFGVSTLCFLHLETYGRGGGTYFSTSPDPENEITGIRVSFSIFGQLMR